MWGSHGSGEGARGQKAKESRGGMRAAGNLGGGKSEDRGPGCPPLGPSSPGPTGHPLSSPTTTLRSDASCKLENSMTVTPWDPCLALHLHQFPQQGKKSRDDLPLADRTGPSGNHSAPRSYRCDDWESSSAPPDPSPPDRGSGSVSQEWVGVGGQREQEHGSQGTWLGPATDSRSQDLGLGGAGGGGEKEPI